ncbi:MAG: SUMF1/EgtB/PvdO family nonheme iron enzyme [Chloroflexi bacterium]|nr:SUMF1/EgtB/PvdO family nonheme iron enzyme [Chloroflexota bacterium]
MTKRWLFVPLLFILLLFALLSGADWQTTSQAAVLPASLDVPFFSQTALRNQTVATDPSYQLGNSDLPLWEYGCGVASLAMVYRHYGVDTDVARLNAALRTAGGFSGGLLAWGNGDAFIRAGGPWVKGVERINTARPQDYRQRIDAALDNGEPVIAFLNAAHYVVITGVEGDSYRINDPWAVTADAGQDIAIAENLLKKGGFDRIRQVVFVSRQEYASTNRVLVQGTIRDKYIASRGAQGPLGNPLQPEEALTGGGVWQRFAAGAIFAPANAKPTLLFGPVWEKFQAEGGVARLGLPRSDVYSYFVGPSVEQRADFAAASLLWTEGERPNQARTIDAASGVHAEYFANPDLSGKPAYTRFEEAEPLFDWREGAPGPWVGVDGFSARFTHSFAVGGLGWWYNFVVDADDGVRVAIDGKSVLDAWDRSPDVYKFRSRLGRGEHTLVIEYRERSGPAHLRFARSDWPATPVFAAESTLGSFETLPVSVAASLPDLGTPIAQATAAAVIATLTAEAGSSARPGSTPTPDTRVADAARANFERWAQNNGEPFRDVQVAVTENDGFFAGVQVIAWFRPGRSAPWEEREAALECRQVGGEWQCDERFAFALSQGEATRRAQATATVLAQATGTAQAQAAATAVANMPAALQNLYDRFGLEFVHVPAGEFLMGSTEADIEVASRLCSSQMEDEITCSGLRDSYLALEMPQHSIIVDAFWIGTTEITNAQYQAFVEAGGYTQRDLWTEIGWKWRKSSGATKSQCWDDKQWNQPDHPVVCVNWYEAVAYVHWLVQESGLPIRLPSEAEWEKAARGIDGRTWPWGNELPDGSRMNQCDANCEFKAAWKTESADDGYSTTAPVGSYPAGASPYGALDMAGNIWEWTNTAWGGCSWPSFVYPYQPDDGREDLEDSGCRVLRGGSWQLASYFGRAAARFIGGKPDENWDVTGGFRVVVSSVPVP